MPVYSVIVCPKCRKSAQLIEQKGAKTTKCQRCGATLQTRKLRIFHTTDVLEDAIAVRTKLQTKILGKGYDTIADKYTVSTFTSDITEEDTNLKFQTKTHQATHIPIKKDPAKTVLSILEKARSEMQMTELHDHALRQDLDEEIFERTLEKLLQKGDIYFPKKGYVRMVP
jgi:DNA replicative helicase MCM subunit Mcm2 (Cdc46/Mcm family)